MLELVCLSMNWSGRYLLDATPLAKSDDATTDDH